MSKKILITSVGSLVGQNVLDSLENRRENIFIVGTNSVAGVANNFRCDKIFLVSEAAETERFIADLEFVIGLEQPDLIVPGRDDDVVILAQLRGKMKNLRGCILTGSVQFAEVMDDKVLSYRFALKHNLPFAPTIASGKPESQAEAQKVLDEFGFPLIAKPSKGNGSRGIWVVLENSQLKKVLSEPGFSIQPFFRNKQETTFSFDTVFGLPFFWEIEENSLFAAQVIIKKNQEIDGIFTFISKMVRGKCERMDVCENEELKKIVVRFAEAAVSEGWTGPFNIQFKKDFKHGFQAIEMNGRFSGGTSARYFLGFDEVGRIINDWVGENTIPVDSLPTGNRVVTKILKDYAINEQNVDGLLRERVWSVRQL